MAPAAFAPVPNAWGQRGATTVTLARVSIDELQDALAMAWRRALPVKRAKPPRRGAKQIR